MAGFTLAGLLWRLVAVLVCLTAVSCLPIAAGPDLKDAFTGDAVNITCRHQPTVTYADWVRVVSGTLTEAEICLNGVCPNGYARRFSVDVNDNFRLTLNKVSRNDSGKYTCVVIDDSETRYTTMLRVVDRTIDSDDTLAVTATSADQASTTAIIQEATDVWYSVTVAIAIIGFIGVAAAIVVFVWFIVRRKGRCRFKTDVEPNTLTINAKEKQKLIDAEGGEINMNKGKTEDPKQIAIQEQAAVSAKKSPSPMEFATKDGHTFAVLFLKVFRDVYAGDNNIAACTARSYTLVVVACKLLWNKHMAMNANKLQIRRLLYYYSSGYGRYASCMKPLQLASGNSPVMGVAVLNGDTYFVRKDSNVVHVVQSNQAKQIDIPDMKNPVDIVACTSSKGLYVADEQARCVWLVVTNQNPVKCMAFAERVPKALSVTRGSLLVTTHSQIIVKYSHVDRCFEEISIRTESPVEPQHAVETSTKTLFVAFKEGRGYNVAEFNSNGQELRRFVCVAALLRFPSYLALDSNGRLLVADFDNNRILLVDSKLEHACAILNQQRDGIAAPQRLCLNESAEELLVVQELVHDSVGQAVYGIKKCVHASANVPKQATA